MSGWFDDRERLRVLCLALLAGVAFILVRGGLRTGPFSTPTVLLGLPAGVGLVRLRRWARPFALALFAFWGVAGCLLIGHACTLGRNHLSLVAGAVLGGWMVWRWTGSETE